MACISMPFYHLLSIMFNSFYVSVLYLYLFRLGSCVRSPDSAVASGGSRRAPRSCGAARPRRHRRSPRRRVRRCTRQRGPPWSPSDEAFEAQQAPSPNLVHEDVPLIVPCCEGRRDGRWGFGGMYAFSIFFMFFFTHLHYFIILHFLIDFRF